MDRNELKEFTRITEENLRKIMQETRAIFPEGSLIIFESNIDRGRIALKKLMEQL